MQETVYFLLQLFKAMIIAHIIVSIFLAINIMNHVSFFKLVYIYYAISNIDYRKAFSRENAFQFLSLGLSYAIFYVMATFKLRRFFGKKYNELLSLIVEAAKKAYEDGLTPEELEERLKAENEEEKQSQG